MKTFLVLISVACSLHLLAQEKSFPATWAGKWTGQLEIYNGAGKFAEIPMELHILPSETLPGAYSWAIIYGEDKEKGLRPYELSVVDAVKGVYLIDEKNSIKMEAYLLGNKLYQWFEVEKNMLFNTTELVGEELHWEIISGSSEPASITGGQKAGDEMVAQVKTFPVKTLQRARLKKA